MMRRLCIKCFQMYLPTAKTQKVCEDCKNISKELRDTERRLKNE